MAAKSKARALVESLTGVQYEDAPAGFTKLTRGGNPFAEPGTVVTGTYEGPGKPRVFPAKGKRPEHTVSTFIVIKGDGSKVELLGSYQIEEFFTEDCAPGDECWIQYQGQVKGGQGGRVNRFKFAVRPREGSRKPAKSTKK